MVVQSQLAELDRFLLTVADDTEESPWMVMSGVQTRGTDLLLDILRLYVEHTGLPWYLETFLAISMLRPDGARTLEAAPDLLMVEAEDRARSSWSIPDEGKAPQFVLEVTVASSWHRDTVQKPRIYEAMGVREFALFAPERHDGGPQLFGYRRDDAARWVHWDAGPDGILWSRELGGLGLVVDDRLWLRALDPRGERLLSSRELARLEGRARAAEALRREAAETEAARLREELRRLREERSF